MIPTTIEMCENIAVHTQNYLTFIYCHLFSVSETLVNVIRLENITSKLISVSWTGINLDQQIQYKVKLESGSNSSQSETSATKAVFSDLTPGTMYTLIIEYLSCSIKKYISANIITGMSKCFQVICLNSLRTYFC